MANEFWRCSLGVRQVDRCAGEAGPMTIERSDKVMNNLVPGRSAWMLLAGFAALALILVALLAACGGDAAPGEDATTAAPAPEATDRVRAPAPGSPATDREILVTFYNALDGPNWEDSGNWLSDAPLGEWDGVTTDDNGRVIWLQMGGSGSRQELSGEIPLELIDPRSLGNTGPRRL